MKITPLDIRRKEFKRSVRGYLDEDVDLFLDGVADELERLTKENGSLQDRVRALEEQAAGHTHIREALEKTLVAAQLQSEEIRSNAQKEGESILREAEVKAKAMVADLYSQTQKVQQTLIQLKLLEEDFRFKFRALLEGYLKLLSDGPVLLGDLRTDSDEGETAMRPPAEADGALVEAERDDDPTSETASVVSQPVQGEDPTQVADYLTEESAVGGGALVPEGRPPRLPKAGKSKSAPEDKGVYFGKLEDDPDDPFPGSDAGPARARDFEW